MKMLKKRRQKTKGKKKKFKTGKIKRHKLRLETQHKGGFGKSITTPTVTFRVEFYYCDRDTEEEDNFQVHWVECRKFVGEERENLLKHYDEGNDKFHSRETLESKFVCVYISKFLCKNKDKLRINRAFIFPTTKKDNETIRQPIYQVHWTEKLEKGLQIPKLDVVLKNAIYHHPFD